jgi:hypothetical protein
MPGDQPVRWICSYYGNLYADAYAVHLAEMKAMGFTTVVLCVPEHYVTHSLGAVHSLVAATHAAGLECWIDPWGVAGVFDGEAPHNPTGIPEATIAWWIDSIGNAPVEARPDAVFWDNPKPAVPYLIGAWAARARTYGMGSHVSLSADRHKDDLTLFRRVAGLDVVDGIGTYPYILEPSRVADFDIEQYVGNWAHDVAKIASSEFKMSHVWFQTFGLPAGHEDIPIRAAQVALTHGVNGLGVWSFRACETWQNRPERHREVWERFGAFMRGQGA